MNNTRKGFAYRLGHGLGGVVAGVRSLERRALMSASGKSASMGLLTKLVVLAIKIGIVVALGALLLTVFSWVIASLLMIAAVLVASRLLAGIDPGEGFTTHGYDEHGNRLNSYGNPRYWS